MIKIKYNAIKSIKKYKARLVVQKLSQIYEIDYTKIFGLIIRYKWLQIFLAIIAILEMILI